MSIELFRIDDRLIHGQVVEGWLNHLGVNMVIVANDLVASDDMQKMLMQMAVPGNINIMIDAVDNVLNFFKTENEKNKILLLVSNPKDAFRLIDGGIAVTSLNVGGIHYCSGKTQILEILSVDKNDCEYFHLISQKNIKLEGQALPSSEKVDILKCVCRFEGEKKD